MVARRITQPIAFILLLVGNVGIAHSQLNDEQEARRLRVLRQLQLSMDQLEGHDGAQDEKIRAISEKYAETDAKCEQLIHIIGPLTDWIKAQRPENQKASFWNEVIKWACEKTPEDRCEIKQRFQQLDDHERRIRNLEEQQAQKPIQADHSLIQNPKQPSPAPFWNGHIDYILVQWDERFGTPVLVRKCINYSFADGDVYHGNIYRDAYGRYILVRHQQSKPLVHSVARQPIQ